MLNARRILKNINKMTPQEKIGLHSGRKPWLLDVAVDGDFGEYPARGNVYLYQNVHRAAVYEWL